MSRVATAAIAGVAALLLTGCVPTARDTVALPQGTRTAALFACASSTVEALNRADAHWRVDITRNDTSAGRFETGDFDEANVMGYRVRIDHREGEPGARVELRAAGPSFADLGAERALSRFESTLVGCVGNRRGESP